MEIPSQTIDWIETVVNLNKTNENNPVNFVIFPYPNGGWAAQCVPPSLSKKFEQRVSFPKSWAGQTDKLSGISGVTGSTFCHNGCFFARAISKESIINMLSSYLPCFFSYHSANFSNAENEPSTVLLFSRSSSFISANVFSNPLGLNIYHKSDHFSFLSNP